MKKVAVYICNVCGNEYDSEREAVYCHPDIIEKEYEVKTFKNRKGDQIEFKEKPPTE